MPVRACRAPTRGDYTIYRRTGGATSSTCRCSTPASTAAIRRAATSTLNLDPPCPETFEPERTMLGGRRRRGCSTASAARTVDLERARPAGRLRRRDAQRRRAQLRPVGRLPGAARPDLQHLVDNACRTSSCSPATSTSPASARLARRSPARAGNGATGRRGVRRDRRSRRAGTSTPRSPRWCRAIPSSSTSSSCTAATSGTPSRP